MDILSIMVNTGVLQLEERLRHKGKNHPSLTSLVKNFLLDIFSHERYLIKEMEDHTFQGRFEEAAEYACRLRQYEHAFTLYNQAVAKGNWMANIHAAELAEFQGDYQR